MGRRSLPSIRRPGRSSGSSSIRREESQLSQIIHAREKWGLNIEKMPITREMEEEHKYAVRSSTNHELWKSHAVVVVDQSGSMRMTDTKNGVSRSDLAWVCLAVDYVGRRLRTGEATSRDYFTLVELGVVADV